MIKYYARLVTESGDAKSVSESLEVDNVRLEGLKIKTGHKGDKIITEIESGNINTLISALDDLLASQLVAEGLLKE